MRPAIDPTALAAVVARYPSIGAFTGVSRNGLSINTAACLFTTTTGSYFAKRYDPDPAEHVLIRHLLAAGFPTPKLHADAEGETLSRHDGASYAIFDLARGEDRYGDHPVFAPYMSLEEVQAAGAMLARFHLAVRDSTLSHRPSRGLSARYRLMRGPSIASALGEGWPDEVVSWLEERRRTIAPHLDRLPEGVIHGDFIKRNLFWSGSTVTDVIDFDLWNVDYWVFDLALALLPVGFDWPEVLAGRREPDLAAMRRFLAGYASIRPLEAAERAVLPAMLETARLEFYLSAIAMAGDDAETAARFEHLLRATLKWFMTHPAAIGEPHG